MAVRPATADAWDWEVIARWCRRVAARHAGHDAADDVAQEAVLRAWRRRHSCRDPSHPWPWLAQITRNEAIRHGTRQPLDCSVLDDMADGSPVGDSLLERMAVQGALATLGPRDRLLMRLYYECDLSVTTVAELTGMSPGAVKVRLHRARVALRSVLEPGDRR